MDESANPRAERMPDGEALAFADLYRRSQGRVKAYFRRCGFSPADVEDLTQDVFIRIFKSLHTFDAARGPLSPWLATVVRNVARRRWQRRTPADGLDPEMAEALLAAPEDAAGSPEAREQTAALAGCIESLPPDLARMVRLRYVDGLTTRGIAEASRMAEATVRLRLAEAKGLLERCLKAKGVWE
jgi:RNA polymerase sigma-70 factor (ECF subfamily)